MLGRGSLYDSSLVISIFYPLDRPADYDNYFRTYFRPYVRSSTFQNTAKQNKHRLKIMITTGGTVCLAEGIIDATCLVSFIFTNVNLLLIDILLFSDLQFLLNVGYLKMSDFFFGKREKIASIFQLIIASFINF